MLRPYRKINPSSGEVQRMSTVMKKFCAGFWFCAMALCSAQSVRAQNASGAEQAGPYGTLEIRDVTVIDGSGAPAFGPVNIYIKGNRIERVSSGDAIARERREEQDAGAKEKETNPPDRVIEGKG